MKGCKEGCKHFRSPLAGQEVVSSQRKQFQILNSGVMLARSHQQRQKDTRTEGMPSPRETSEGKACRYGREHQMYLLAHPLTATNPERQPGHCMCSFRRSQPAGCTERGVRAGAAAGSASPAPLLSAQRWGRRGLRAAAAASSGLREVHKLCSWSPPGPAQHPSPGITHTVSFSPGCHGSSPITDQHTHAGTDTPKRLYTLISARAARCSPGRG